MMDGHRIIAYICAKHPKGKFIQDYYLTHVAPKP
jgi:hypothetical protein